LQILELALMLRNHYEKLLEYWITDFNFTKNFRFLIDLFLRKKFFENNLIECIILYEIEAKAEFSEQNLFFTLGPNKVFKSIFFFFEILKDNNLFNLLDVFLNFVNKIIIQFLAMIDFIIIVIIFY
jgi:hypothetical protein